MSIIQEKIYLGKNASGATLTFGLSRNTDFTGYQQEIDNITEETKQELINPITDFEINRFKYSVANHRLKFYFLDYSNSNSDNIYTNAGFSSAEISDKADVVRNSFFILDFYDTYINNIQTRLFTNYQTQIGSLPQFQFGSQGYQMSYCNVPKWFLDEQNTDPIEIYVKFSFYNAKDGKLLLFYNNSINDATNPENMYFRVNLYPQTKTWKFLTDINAYELTPSSEYVQKNNETVQNFENKKQDYPSGNLFKDDGTYDDSQ